MTFSRLLIAVLCSGVMLGGCKGKDGDPGPAGAAGAVGATGPSGQNLTGSLVGFVNPVDENGVALSKAGVTVTITSVTPQIIQTTDANGRYEFTNQRNGTYNLTFSRSDLGTNKIFGYGLVGGDQPSLVGTTNLVKQSTTSVINLSVQSPAYSSSLGYYANFSGYFFNNTNVGSYRRVVLYASATSGVNSTTGTLVGGSYIIYQPYGSSTLATFQVPRGDFNAAGFVTGTPAYAIVYGVPYGLYGSSVSYTDIATGKQVLTGLNPVGSQVISFIVP